MKLLAWRVTQVVLVLVMLGLLVRLFGTSAVTEAGAVLAWWTVPAAIVLGLLGGVVQGLRWQAVAAGLGDEMPRRHAVARCFEAAFLNAVLPGGLAGDAVRAVQRRRAGTGWGAGVGSVVGERLVGTAVVTLAATVAAAVVGHLEIAVGLGVITLVVAGVAAPSLRRLPASTIGWCVAWSVLGWLAYLGLFLLAATQLARAGVTPAVGHLAPWLGSLTLAGMSVPVNVAGWGPREGAASLAYDLVGLGGAAGFTTSIGYGLLALVSVTPGLVVLVTGLVSTGRTRRTRRRPE
ncbi:MAG: lysylphosphatidylglycerol synthase domain-containing protein [Mobilicoccus sp.]|nr:lysylphosphatidylglycerol synthase domain-containing protein [Mobilicoccus sp.]